MSSFGSASRLAWPASGLSGRGRRSRRFGELSLKTRKHDPFHLNTLRLEFRLIFGGRQPDHLAEMQPDPGEGFGQHETIPTVEIPGTVRDDVKRDDHRIGGVGDPDETVLDDACRSPGSVDDMASQPGLPELFNQLPHGLHASAGGGAAHGFPAGASGHGGDDLAVLAPGDHQPRPMGAIGLKMADGGEELLVPGAKQHPAAVLMIHDPGGFVLHLQAKRPGVGADEPVEKGEKRFRHDDGIGPSGHGLSFPGS
jgi:hypothetical protein